MNKFVGYKIFAFEKALITKKDEFSTCGINLMQFNQNLFTQMQCIFSTNSVKMYSSPGQTLEILVESGKLKISCVVWEIKLTRYILLFEGDLNAVEWYNTEKSIVINKNIHVELYMKEEMEDFIKILQKGKNSKYQKSYLQ